MQKNDFDFETKIKRIQEIVELLDAGEGTLEVLIENYKEGMKLSAECRDFLEKTENEIIDITNTYSPSDM